MEDIVRHEWIQLCSLALLYSDCSWLSHLAPVIISPVAGSFVATAAVRWGMGQSVILGRSRCLDCKVILAPHDLIPVFSWLIGRAKCRHCGSPVSAIYPLTELAAAMIAILAATALSGPSGWVGCLFGWALLLLVGTDVTAYLLPDRVTLPLIASGLLWVATVHPAALADHLVGAASGFVVFASIRSAYRALRGREGLGLGDAKLIAVAGAWTGWATLPTIVLASACMAIFVTYTTRPSDRLSLTGTRVPFGAYLCGPIWVLWLYRVS